MSSFDEEEVLIADVEADSLPSLEAVAKKAYTGTNADMVASNITAKSSRALDWTLTECLRPVLGTKKSVATVLKSVNAMYLKTISNKGTITVFTGLTAEAFEKEVERQLAKAEKGIKYSEEDEKELALEAIEEARDALRRMGLDGEARLGLKRVYDPETQRGYSTVMVLKVLPTGDGVSRHLVVGHGSIYYEYRGSKLCVKPIEMDSAQDALYKPTLELAAFAQIGEIITERKPHRGKWEATKEEVTWITSLVTNTACAIITAINPTKKTTLLA